MKRLVFLGDSITDCYHNFDPQGLGEGYVRQIFKRLCKTDASIQIINKGFDGFTIPALKRLCKQQFSSLSPDLLTILIGINDIGVLHNTGTDAEFALEEFRMGYRTLLNDIRRSYSGPVILMEPFIFPYPERYILRFESLKKMNQIIADIAKEYALYHISLWDEMLLAAKKEGYDAITTDGIHLTPAGHRIITENWINTYKKIIL